MALETNSLSTQYKIINDFDHAARLDRLYHNLPKDPSKKKTILDGLDTLWNKILEAEDVSQDFIKKQITPTLRRLFMASVYSDTLNSKEHNQKEWAQIFLKDRVSILLPPVIKSKEGKMGPTFLMLFNNSENEQVKSVLKWTNLTEIFCNVVYDAFSRGFSENTGTQTLTVYGGCLVPKAEGLHFERNLHILRGGKTSSLSAQDGQKILKSALAITETHTKKENVGNYARYIQLLKEFDKAAYETRAMNEDLEQIEAHELPNKNDLQLMISERILGENLLHFAKTKWQELTIEQKTKTLYHIGEFTILDMLIAHLDRVNAVAQDDEEYVVNHRLAATNMGNLMLVKLNETDAPLIYVIDNEIDRDLAENPKHQEQYLTFLNTLFKSLKSEAPILTLMIKKIEDLTLQAKEEQGEFEGRYHSFLLKLQEGLKEQNPEMLTVFENATECFAGYLDDIEPFLTRFCKDLSSILPKTFQKGFENMLLSALFHENSLQGNCLKELTRLNYSELILSIIATEITNGMHLQIEKKNEFKVFSDDLYEIGGKALKHGFEKMLSRLRKTLIPRWEKEETIKTTLKENCASLLTSLEGRINSFTTNYI